MELFGLIWQRPLGLLALSLPLLVFILARRPLRPHRLATGALSLWRRVHESASGAGGERPRLPLSLWWLVIGLTFGALSLAGPTEPSSETSQTWRVIVDRSPGAYLKSPGDDALRIDAALALLDSEWKRGLGDRDKVRWFDGTEWLEGREFPEAWRTPPGAALEAPAFLEQDLPGTIWLCQVQPKGERRIASLCAGGATPSPGPVAIDGEDRIDWTLSGLQRVEGGAPLRSIRMVGIEGAFAEFVSLWADERGLRLNDSSEGVVEILQISVESSGGEDLAQRPGQLFFTEKTGPPLGSDPVEFALSWSRRLDSLCLPPAGFSTVSARALTGMSAWGAGEPPIEDFTGDPSQGAWAGWLALLSCGFVALAMLGVAR